MTHDIVWLCNILFADVTSRIERTASMAQSKVNADKGVCL